jgi:hypothetical protein
MKVVKFADVTPEEWDAVVEASPWAWLHHLSHWIILETKYWFPVNHSFLIRADNGQPLAVLPLYLSDVPVTSFVERLLHSGIHRHTGLAVVPTVDRKQLKQVRSCAMHEVFRIASEAHADRIQLNAHNLAPGNLPPYREEIPFFVEDFHFYFGLKFGPYGFEPAPGQTTCCSDQIISLDQDEAALFGALENRTVIRKGLREGVEVIEAKATDSLLQSIELRRAAAARTQQTLMPDQYYADVLALSARGQQQLLLAKWQGKVIGGLQLLIYKGASTYFEGFGLNEYLSLRYYDVLHWHAILWSKCQGLKHYRLGPHFPDTPKDYPIQQKGRFKKKFGGQAYHSLQGTYFLVPEKYAPKTSPHIVTPLAAPDASHMTVPLAFPETRDANESQLSTPVPTSAPPASIGAWWIRLFKGWWPR